MNLRLRSYQPELLDADDLPFEDIRRNMHELQVINQWLGGHDITLKGFKALLPKAADKNNIHICEIGCGGGDNLAAIVAWGKRHGINIQCTGIDIKQYCIDVAQQHPLLQQNMQWITSDYRAVDFARKPDIIFCSLFCHHFTEQALVQQLQWMQQNSTAGFFINDLHRHQLAYFSIHWLTQLFSRSYLVKNDAPLSVARGFIKTEWQQLLQQANIHHYNLRWQWAFRHLLVYTHD
ncbi:methyltransferase domain-containing protein [Deminuibacter soli]|uniref:Methyltransferase domain-containing protein n=1 Tax=Deminuibacter soli TaxID=2291815 RepID=A0A3E1NPU0_9BACT|nr:methyltransferase domain-containing protein [Deminuibacter soli]RFM29844.1 methyltransferase domain-containing protein [Deminuibacter soli]